MQYLLYIHVLCKYKILQNIHLLTSYEKNIECCFPECYLEELEDTRYQREVIRIRKSKDDRQQNGQRKKGQKDKQ